MIKEIILFVWNNKKWWLIPPIIVFVLFGILIAVSTPSPLNPFVYMLF